jgi:SAM-dependent methyltransferase
LASAASDREQWQMRYRLERFPHGIDPLPFLKQNAHLLPKGRALDVAMGAGRNAVYLAQNGWQVLGIDYSLEGVRQARWLAHRFKVRLDALVADLEHFHLPTDYFDLVVQTYYLQRELLPQIAATVRTGGAVLIETYTQKQREYQPERDPAHLLEPGELLQALFDFRIAHHFEGVIVQNDRPRAVEQIIGFKPTASTDPLQGSH